VARAKLTPEEVFDISISTGPTGEIAKKFEISSSTVIRIRKRERNYGKIIEEYKKTLKEEKIESTIEIPENIPKNIEIDKTISNNLPIGTIVMWSGEKIPKGWSLCDGSNNTPDLSDKFILGTIKNNELLQTGGYKDCNIMEHDHIIDIQKDTESVIANVEYNREISSETISFNGTIKDEIDIVIDQQKNKFTKQYESFSGYDLQWIKNEIKNSNYNIKNVITRIVNKSKVIYDEFTSKTGINKEDIKDTNYPPYVKLKYIMYKGI